MVLLKVKFTFQKRVHLAQTLWMLCWLSVLTGILTFALGIYLKCELKRRSEVMDNTDIHLVPNTLIVVGLLSMLLNFIGVKISSDSLDLAKFPRWKGYVEPYLVFSFLFTFLMLFASLLSYFMRGNLDASLKIGLRNGIRFYKDTDTPGRCYQKRTIDHIQMEFQCCGNNNYKDWFDVQWISNRYLDFNNKEVRDRIKSNVDGRYLIDGVPFSCCNPNSPRPCIQRQITNNSAHFNYEFQTEELNLWMTGCREALLSYYTGMMATIGTSVLLCYVTQLGVLIGLRYLSIATEAVVAQENPECDSEGYLLEKGPLETLYMTAKALKAKFNFNEVQTEPAPTETAATEGNKTEK
ncbi:RDS/peripherin-like protein xRDS35 [Hemiscyllium ocellatum]|uniref:RDS/peripherin-like protein xRDS35 n=1 Tax=Hemiscyllium ocellatum TaxID=170820 RepID=UPI0029669F43|nr:RDS/peripherin-like protein xRDS35 [Hemiscyllium ocellatum]